MGQETNGEVEVNVEVNYVENYDDKNITNDKYLPPSPNLPVFQLNKDKVKELNALIIPKGKTTSVRKDKLLENIKVVIGDAEKFTVKYSSEIVDATVVTSEVNQIKSYVPPIAWVVMNE